MHKMLLSGIKLGGYRPNSFKWKSGYYKGFRVDSTWECAYYIYCINNNINILRNTEIFIVYEIDGVSRKFYPDFIVNGSLVEIKGIISKESQVKELYSKDIVKFLYEKDLIEVFDFIENFTKLKIKDLYKIYDNYKPKLNLCLFCNQNHVKRKNSKFCSNSCSLKYRHKQNIGR